MNNVFFAAAAVAAVRVGNGFIYMYILFSWYANASIYNNNIIDAMRNTTNERRKRKGKKHCCKLYFVRDIQANEEKKPQARRWNINIIIQNRIKTTHANSAFNGNYSTIFMTRSNNNVFWVFFVVVASYSIITVVISGFLPHSSSIAPAVVHFNHLCHSFAHITAIPYGK